VFSRIIAPSPANPSSHPKNRDGKDPENHLDFSPLVVNAIFVKNKIHDVPSTVAPCVEIASSEKSNSFPIPVSSPEAARKRDFSPSFGGRLKIPVPFSGGDLRLMKWTIFSRLVFGYLLIAFLVLAMSGYAVFELGQLERLTYSILQTDNRIMDLEKKMTDSMLSQMRYEQKFVITKDRELYQQFLLARDDFQKYAREAMITAGASDPKDLVDTLTAKQKIYEALFEEEVRLIQSNLPYDLQRYKKEKEKTIDLIMADLQALEAASQQGAFEKIRKLGEAGANASKVAMILAVSALIGVILISLFITRSITLPVAKLIDKAREISNWVFKADLNLTSPPEIQELALAINSMCEKLKAVDKMKSDFFSIMAHELRTPLTSIKEGTSLLLEGVGGGITDTQKKLLKIIAVESHRLIDLVNASLDLSKIEAGMMAFNFTPAEVSALLQRVATEVRPWAMAKGVRIEVQNPPGLPPVPMDTERILQVLRNLIGNAIKFTPDGGTVTVLARQEEKKVFVTVRDTGIGISKENLTDIFEKYRQGDPQHSEYIKGTGLGLAIVKHIVAAHGGNVWAESDPGQGSSFTFYLPA
jgi:two-component system sensor histidine kinase GlrK